MSMVIEQNIQRRIEDLIERGIFLTGHSSDEAKCAAWLAPARHIIEIVCPNPESSYRRLSHEIFDEGFTFEHLYWKVENLTQLLANLLDDFKNGLLSSVIDRVKAEDFDNFLDHAVYYADKSLKNESGSIAGVVFEDTIRRISEKNSIQQKDISLENLINALVKAGLISAVKAKWARAAAHVRTKATHAQWDEFELDDVRKTIEFTRELILHKLDS
jgi:hypothetical protein